MSRNAFSRSCAALLSGLLLSGACNKAEPAAEPAPQAQPLSPPSAAPAATAAPAAPAAPVDQPAAPAAVSGETADKSGWAPLSRRDDLPLCVFSDHVERERAQLLAAAKSPQKLRANTKLVFGVFGPHCLNEACDERPNLQCWVDSEAPRTLVVHTRFSSLHKTGSTCARDCLEVDSACETAELPPGKYDVRYGDRTYKLTIPGTLRDPCLRRE